MSDIVYKSLSIYLIMYYKKHFLQDENVSENAYLAATFKYRYLSHIAAVYCIVKCLFSNVATRIMFMSIALLRLG